MHWIEQAIRLCCVCVWVWHIETAPINAFRQQCDKWHIRKCSYSHACSLLLAVIESKQLLGPVQVAWQSREAGICCNTGGDQHSYQYGLNMFRESQATSGRPALPAQSALRSYVNCACEDLATLPSCLTSAQSLWQCSTAAMQHGTPIPGNLPCCGYACCRLCFKCWKWLVLNRQEGGMICTVIGLLRLYVSRRLQAA